MRGIRSHLTAAWFLSTATVALVAVAAVFGGCSSVRLIEDYDPVIDQGLTQYYEAADQFLSTMSWEAAQGSSEAAYEENRDYYAEARTKLNSLILRARAQSTSERCVGSDAVATVLNRLLSVDALRGQIPRIGELVDQLREEQTGSCTVQILTVVRTNHDVMEAIHAHNDKLAPAVVDILRPTIEQGVQMALRIELAKKRGEE